MRNIDKFITELKSLQLPIEEYLIISSGPLAIHNIRECNDLDILVLDNLFDELSKTYPVIIESTLQKISLGNIEFLNMTSYIDPEKNFKYQRDRADIIEGVPFQDLESSLFFKEKGERDKDKKDVELIKKYLTK